MDLDAKKSKKPTLTVEQEPAAKQKAVDELLAKATDAVEKANAHKTNAQTAATDAQTAATNAQTAAAATQKAVDDDYIDQATQEADIAQEAARTAKNESDKAKHAFFHTLAQIQAAQTAIATLKELDPDADTQILEDRIPLIQVDAEHAKQLAEQAAKAAFQSAQAALAAIPQESLSLDAGLHLDLDDSEKPDSDSKESRLYKLSQMEAYINLSGGSDFSDILNVLHLKLGDVIQEFQAPEISPEDFKTTIAKEKNKDKYKDPDELTEKVIAFHKDGHRIYKGTRLSAIDQDKQEFTLTTQAILNADGSQKTPATKIKIKLIPPKATTDAAATGYVLAISGQPPGEKNVIDKMIEAAMQAKKKLAAQGDEGKTIKYTFIIYPHTDTAKVKELYQKAEQYGLTPILKNYPEDDPRRILDDDKFADYHKIIGNPHLKLKNPGLH